MPKAQKKPYLKKLSKEDKRISDQRLSMRVVHQAKDSSRSRAKMPKYTPQLEDEALEYTPQPEEEVPKCTPQYEDKEPEYTPQSYDEMGKDNFDIESEDDLQINCSIVSVFPAEYDRVSEVSEAMKDCVHEEVMNQKHLCYYVMNKSVVEEQQAIFER